MFTSGITPGLEAELEKVLQYIHDQYASTNLWPSLAKTAGHFHISRTKLGDWVSKLEAQNKVKLVIPPSRINGYLELIDHV